MTTKINIDQLMLNGGQTDQIEQVPKPLKNLLHVSEIFSYCYFSINGISYGLLKCNSIDFISACKLKYLTP